MPHVDRRTFLKGSLAAAGATFLVGVPGREVLGANDMIHVGVAGIHGRGGGHIGSFMRIQGVRVTYLIDIDTHQLDRRYRDIEGRYLKEERRQYVEQLAEDERKAYKEAEEAHKKHEKLIRSLRKKKPEELSDEQKQELAEARAAEKAYKAKSQALTDKLRKGIEHKLPTRVQDVRKALDDKDLHAISIATPNHWHALMTVWACQAGKDVYVEKPCSHNIFEGRKAVEAARKYQRIVQHGTQSRSTGRWAKLAAIARSGKLGKVLVSHGIASKPRGGIGHK
ncbi:MAG: Gfo/Idh/MocA family oxidoreductase, partial [Planctomycetota bacterium]